MHAYPRPAAETSPAEFERGIRSRRGCFRKRSRILITPESEILIHAEIALLDAGDAAAWRSFVADALPMIRSIVARQLNRAGRGDDVRDVVQDVFVRLCKDGFRTLRRFDPQRAQLSTYLGVIATGVAIDHLRRSTLPTIEVDPDSLAAAANDPLAAAALDLPHGVLTPRQVLILRMLYELGYEVKEVAAALNIEPQTVRSLHHKAIVRLRIHGDQGHVE